MIPILFTENSNTFTTNGIGRLSDAISCVVTEERNGQFELSMVYPADGKHFEDITLRALIVADASPAQTKQPFRIYKISKPINGKVTINAQHISYDLSKNVSMPFSVSASSSACANALNGLKTNAVETCPFTFSTNVTTVASFAQLAPATIRQMMGGVEGSVLDQFGGEYKFDKFAVSLMVSRGTTKNIPLRYGKNITDIKQEENIANTITGIVPFWSDSEGGDMVTLPEKVLHSSNAGSYSSYLTIPVDFSSDFEEKPTESQLRTHGQAYINKNGIGIPKVSIDVSFVNLPDTEEYKGLLNLLQLELCDTIPVEFSKLGISASAKVVKTEYNTLKDRYDRITVGEVGATLAKTITGVSDSVTGLADATKTNFAKAGNETDAKITDATQNFPTRQEVQQEVDNATAWLTSMNGVMRASLNSNNEWQSLLFMDENATATTGNVMRLNKNGIVFSFTGWNGTFYQGWTMDGHILIGGTNIPSLTVYDNNNNVIFQVDKTKVVWNASNSSMDSSGTITAKNVNLSGTISSSNAYGDFMDMTSGVLRGYSVDLSDQPIDISMISLTPVNGDAMVNINTKNMDLGITGQLKIMNPNNYSYRNAFTGTSGGLQFINGICVT
jgi:phage minor structural protein